MLIETLMCRLPQDTSCLYYHRECMQTGVFAIRRPHTGTEAFCDDLLCLKFAIAFECFRGALRGCYHPNPRQSDLDTFAVTTVEVD